MNDRNGENLRELFERFFNDKETEDYIEDIAKVDRILDENPAPEPSEELVAAINHKIAEAVRLREAHTFRRFAYKLAPVAAVFIVIAAVGVRIIQRDSGPIEVTWMSVSDWESDNVAADDRNLAVFTAEVDELEVEFTTLEREGNGGNGRSAVIELEMDFVAISNDIWEG